MLRCRLAIRTAQRWRSARHGVLPLVVCGVSLDRRPTAPAQARIARRGDNAWVEVRIVEGRNRQVRRMLEAVGHPVLRLRRTAYGPLTLGRLAAGELRPLDDAEIDALRHAARPPASSR